MYDLTIEQASAKCKEFQENLNAHGIFNNVKEYPNNRYIKCIEIEVKRAFSPSSKNSGYRVFYDIYIRTRATALENKDILNFCASYNWCTQGKSHECKDIASLLATLQEIEEKIK